MSTWNVFIVAASPNEVDISQGSVAVTGVTEDQISELTYLLRDLGAGVSFRPYRFTVSMAVEAEDQVDALRQGIRRVDEAGHKVEILGWELWDFPRVEVTDWNEFERELERPTYPPILGIAELAEMLGTSKQRASVVARNQDFPRPYAELASGPVWFEPHVRRFVDEWERKPGRPRKERTESSSVVVGRDR